MIVTQILGSAGPPKYLGFPAPASSRGPGRGEHGLSPWAGRGWGLDAAVAEPSCSRSLSPKSPLWGPDPTRTDPHRSAPHRVPPSGCAVGERAALQHPECQVRGAAPATGPGGSGTTPQRKALGTVNGRWVEAQGSGGDTEKGLAEADKEGAPRE